MCSAAAAAGCFPGAATVVLASGATAALRDLRVGDRVQVVKADGATAFEDVYFFDHELDGEVRHAAAVRGSPGQSGQFAGCMRVACGRSAMHAAMPAACMQGACNPGHMQPRPPCRLHARPRPITCRPD